MLYRLSLSQDYNKSVGKEKNRNHSKTGRIKVREKTFKVFLLWGDVLIYELHKCRLVNLVGLTQRGISVYCR